MEFPTLILVLIVCIGFSLFIAYKMVLFFSDKNEKNNTRRGRANKFFKNTHEKNEDERKRQNDTFNWEVFKTKIQAHLLPAAIAGLLIAIAFHVMGKPMQTEFEITKIIPWLATPHSEVISTDLIEQPGSISSWNDGNTRSHESLWQKNTGGRETPIVIENNQILVPVVIGHKGRTVKAYFLLDTGCTTTLLHQTITERIQPDITNIGTSTVADGRAVTTNFCRVDFIQVGPFTENNFTATTNYVAGGINTTACWAWNF